MSRRQLCITAEDRPRPPIHYLLQVDAINVYRLLLTRIDRSAVVFSSPSEERVQVVEACRQAEMTVDRRHLKDNVVVLHLLFIGGLEAASLEDGSNLVLQRVDARLVLAAQNLDALVLELVRELLDLPTLGARLIVDELV